MVMFVTKSCGMPPAAEDAKESSSEEVVETEVGKKICGKEDVWEVAHLKRGERRGGVP